MKKVFVNSVPVVRMHHYPVVTLGGTYPEIDTPVGGTWWSSDPSSISVDIPGKIIVLGPTLKEYDTLVYSVTTTCGTSSDTMICYLPSSVKNVTNPNSSLNIFPNPNKGTFTVAFVSESEEMANVVITNIMGQKVKEFMAPANKLSEISIDQPDGIYLLSATTTTARYDVKIRVAR